MDEFRFTLFWADGRQCVCVIVQVRVFPMSLWIEWSMVHFVDGILNPQRFNDEILRPVVVLYIHAEHVAV